MLVEVRLSHPKEVASFLQGGQVGGLVCGVLDHEQDVHYGLGGQPGHRGGADVLDGERCPPERRPYPRLLLAEPLGPNGVVVRDDDGLRLDRPYDDLSEPLLNGIVWHGVLQASLLAEVHCAKLAPATARRNKLHQVPDRAGYCLVAYARLLADTSPVGCLLEGRHVVLARFPIGIAILAPSKVLALRAVVEVLGLDLALLEEEDGKVIVPPLTRVRTRGLLTSQSSTS